MAVLFQFLRLLKPKYLIGGLIAAAAFYFAHTLINNAILKEELKNFKATEAQNNERNETNETINTANPSRLCELNGGVFRNGQCE